MGFKKAAMIVNPIAGTINKDHLHNWVETIVGEKNIALTSMHTKGPGDAERLVREAREDGHDVVIAAGGDGTVNEVASALWGTEMPIAIIPCGSGNGLARSLGIPLDVEKAARMVALGNVAKIDRGELNGKNFYCTCGLGFDAEVSMKFAREPRRGKMTYIKTAFKEFANYKPKKYTLITENVSMEFEALLLAVCNCPQYGNNAFIAPEAQLTDGWLDVTIVRAGHIVNEVRAGVELFSGKLNKNILVDTLKVKKARIVLDEPQPLHVDGEPLDAEGTLEIRCAERGLKVVVPPDFNTLKLSPFKALWQDLLTDIRTPFKNLS